jgi:hypothetical protein
MGELSDYIGSYFDKDIQSKIETEFKPYKVKICGINEFYFENYWVNQIRCVLVDGIITHLDFN